jgi:RNA polymerase sigma-70 factor (ECF subfamily)
LLRYVVTLRVPVEGGEEVVQEVFLALFQHLARGKPRENLRGWIFRVGHNLALKRRGAMDRQSQRQASGDGLEEVPDSAPNPEHAAAMRQRQARLLSAVAVLPEQDRCCLHLRAEGLRYREIAEALGMSLGSVANSLDRSLKRLARADR